jgi:hypothetical protein
MPGPLPGAILIPPALLVVADSEIISVAVAFTVITFGLVFVGSSVVEFVITIGVISLPAYFIFTGFPRTEIIGFDIDNAVGPEQFL